MQFAGVYRTAVAPVPAFNIRLEDWVFVDIAKANVCCALLTGISSLTGQNRNLWDPLTILEPASTAL